MTTRYQFVPWLRRAAAAAIRAVDTLAAGVPARPVLPLKVRVNQRNEVSTHLRLHGPGDVTGLDTRDIVRTDPPHLATDFEPNYFPSVEFNTPDLPWMLTPATGDPQARLRPWLCLVVVRKQPGVSFASDPHRPLPVLTIRSPARPADELPDLAESWAWAHSQVMSADDTPLRELLSNRSRPSLSRLVCPRRLQAGQAYQACLVPAFAAGRNAGLGEPIGPGEDEQLAPAWDLENAPDSLELPVYFQWEFSTGPGGDFEELVRRLQGRVVPDGVGQRSLHVGDAAFGLPDAGVLPLEGALRVPGSPSPAPALPAFGEALQQLLNRPDALRQQLDDEPIVAPPIYGSWQAAEQRMDAQSPLWLREANLDPRMRAAAGLGTLVVQDQQEELMASAWEQLGAAGHEQRQIHQQQLSREVLRRVHAGLTQLAPEHFLRVTAPLHARIRIESTDEIFSNATADATPATAREQIRRSRLPVSVTSAPFRRVTRIHGPLVRGVTAVDVTRNRTFTFSARFEAVFTPLPTARTLPPAQTVSAAAIEARLRQLIVPSTMLAQASQFNAAVREVGGYLAAATGTAAPPSRPGLILSQLKAVLIQKIDPQRTLPPPIAPSEPDADATSVPDVAPNGHLPSLPGPAFPQPMYEPLRELAPDLLLPGAELIPADSVMLLETNPPVIAAYMLGLNHEMSRELLWREYPSELRATPFRRFWGGRNAMAEIHQWNVEGELGAEIAEGGQGQLVLLLRGDLLRRYPATVIYAAPAVDRRTPGAEKRYPLFRAALAPDCTCLGFDLSAKDARGDESTPGWFFVLEQPPGQARFGLDASVASGRDPSEIAGWNDLAWGDMAADTETFDRLTHAPVSGRLMQRRIDGMEWGLNAGHMAAITLQRPVRVLQHAANLLPPP